MKPVLKVDIPWLESNPRMEKIDNKNMALPPSLKKKINKLVFGSFIDKLILYFLFAF